MFSGSIEMERWLRIISCGPPLISFDRSIDFGVIDVKMDRYGLEKNSSFKIYISLN